MKVSNDCEFTLLKKLIYLEFVQLWVYKVYFASGGMHIKFDQTVLRYYLFQIYEFVGYTILICTALTVCIF